LQAQPTVEPASSNSPVIVKYGAKFLTAQRAPVQQARLFVYRQANATRKEPVNIYIEGRFHTALLSGGYTEFCAAPGRLAILSVYDDAQTMHLGKEVPGQPWQLKAGDTLFLRVNEANATSMSLLEVAPEPAKKDLALTAAQIHVLSRAPVVQTCDAPAPLPPAAHAPAPVVAATAKPPVPRAYALQADALFDFGKTELKVAGYNAIEGLAQRLKRDYSQVDRIRVIGHSDPIGKPKRNRELSLARAERVADQLRDRGIKPVQGFKVEGLGESSPVKTDCGDKPTPANKLCHAPNRRVEIIVYGAKN
jgi:OOP family OmpA-OmpF porin